jgi:hypothetical protein
MPRIRRYQKSYRHSSEKEEAEPLQENVKGIEREKGLVEDLQFHKIFPAICYEVAFIYIIASLTL